MLVLFKLELGWNRDCTIVPMLILISIGTFFVLFFSYPLGFEMKRRMRNERKQFNISRNYFDFTKLLV